MAGLKNARWPGRLEWVEGQPRMLMDGAHNGPGARTLLEYARRHLMGRRVVLLTAMLGDKLLTDVLGANRSGAWAVMVEPAGGPRGAWNHVLHGLQRPFKALCRSRKEAKV